MKIYKHPNNVLGKEEIPVHPQLPEIKPNPKERPATKPEKPGTIPPDWKPDKNKPEIVPVKPKK